MTRAPMEIESARNIVDLAAMLLLFCREHEQEYRRAQNDEALRDAERTALSRGKEFFRRLGTEDLEPEDAQAFSRLLLDLTGPWVLRARAAAVALDEILGSRFQGVFRSKGLLRLQPNSPLPVTRPPLRSLLNPLNTRPERLASRIDRLAHLRLAPASLGLFEVDLDFASGDLLAPLLDERDQVFATCHPNRFFEEFAPPPLPPGARVAEDRFFWVRPKEAIRQRRVLKHLLDPARAAGATVVVLPELCLDPEECRTLLDHVRSTPSAIRLFVAGSHHVEIDGRRRNQALAMLRGRKEPLVHWKCFPYEDRRDARAPRMEDLYLETPRLTIYFNGDWSMVILICKDFLEPRLRNLLEELGVNLLLLPMMTGVADPFEAFASHLTQTNQAFVIVANTPSEPSKVHAIFGGPRRREFSAVVRAPGRGTPGTCLYRPRDGRVSWVDFGSIFD